MVEEVSVVRLYSNPNNENGMVDVVDCYSLLLDSVQSMAFPMYGDEVDIESRKNHSAWWKQMMLFVMVVVHKLMDLLIAKMNYRMMHHSFEMLDRKRNHTFALIHEDVVVYMDGSNIGETFKSGCEKDVYKRQTNYTTFPIALYDLNQRKRKAIGEEVKECNARGVSDSE